MKRTLPALFVVLLVIMPVILMTACDDLSPPLDTVEDDLPWFTEDGRPMVHLSIGVGNISRALTDALARGGVDYYEVAFSDGTRIYRAAWDYTKTGRIAVPPGNYYGPTKAILFAGRYSDKTLLAVGILTKIEDDDVTATAVNTGTAEIGPNTTKVTFTLSPLTNDISTSKTGSTFKITAPTGTPNYATSAITAATIPTAEIDGIVYPIFSIPQGVDTTEAEYTINIPSITITNPSPISQPTNTGIIINSSTGFAPRLVSSGIFYNEDPGVAVASQTIPTITDPITPASFAIPADGKFTLKIDTTGVGAGLSRLSVEIPVNSIAIAAVGTNTPLTWYIRGGMSQNVLDAGALVNSLGGAVLLAVGPVKIRGIDITPTW